MEKLGLATDKSTLISAHPPVVLYALFVCGKWKIADRYRVAMGIVEHANGTSSALDHHSIIGSSKTMLEAQGGISAPVR